MKVASCLLLAIFCSLVSLSYTQTTYSYSFLNNGTCQTVTPGDCIPCQYSHGLPVYYYAIVESNYDGYASQQAFMYSDSACSFEYSYAQLYSERCYTTGSSCTFYSTVSSVSALTLTLSSTDAVSVTLLSDNNSVYTQISSKKIIAQGEELTGVRINSGGKNFYIESQVSDTQYSSSIGIYSFGETYTHLPFTFSVSQTVIEIPPPDFNPEKNQFTSVTFSPFYTAQVTNQNVYPAFTEYESGEINVMVDSNNDLSGLILSNPYFAIVNMTLFPPFQKNNHGQLVFQLEKSNTPFITVECYYDGYSQGSGVIRDTYDCSMGSLSGIFSGSFLSFSLDEFGEPKKVKPDEMSFSLF